MSAGVVNRPFIDSGPRYFPRRQEDINDAEGEQDFATIHLRWCWLGIRVAVRRGDAMIQQVQGAWIAELLNEEEMGSQLLYNFSLSDWLMVLP